MTKGRKRVKGVGHLHDEVKRQISLALTPTAQQRLDEMAEQQGLSRSEFVEQIARGLIPLATPQTSDDVQVVPSENLSQASQEEYKAEFPLNWKTIHLSDWQLLPNRPGVYGVVYNDEKLNLDDVYDYTSKYDRYKPSKLHIRFSQNIKDQFQNELVNETDLREVIESLPKVAPFAYLVSAEVYEETLFLQICQSLIDSCTKAVDSRSLDHLQHVEQQKRDDSTCSVIYTSQFRGHFRDRDDIDLTPFFDLES
ncbi:ribbon-helix-helix protein, CopG family [Microcoleus sp. FACHB-1515]|uniref:ribbon-helix-helix protein, CopG family n=1 Tax=Cyanophyceae TaxID=3028117 RepID=UPI001681E8C7|nr:ribbon-helix-helix protein, CopG family [Microcoleus sp. FACHB-1515]MBD2088831.1 ribbon-helix-helix protein, CopG family [Microcoleus sp. FACHB-1515]